MKNIGKLNRVVDYGNYAVYAIVALIGLVVNWLILDKCLVMSDDAWYLCLLRDLPEGLTSSGHLLFGNIFNNNIYAIRTACYVLNVISGFVFAIGLFCFAGERNCFSLGKNYRRNVLFNILLWSFVIFAGQLRIVTCPSFNYITINQIIMQLSLGMLLIAVSRRNRVAMFFSGFFVAVLVPVMITNTIVIPVIFFFVAAYLYYTLRHNNGEKVFWKDLTKWLIVYVLGMFLFLAIYFVFVQDIRSYLDAFLNNVNETISRGENEYGLKFLCKWLHRTMVFYFMQVVMLAVLLHYIPVFSSLLKLGRKSAFVVKLLLYFAVFVYIRAAVNYDAMFFMMLLAFYLFLDENNVGDRRTQLIFMLLILMPICLSFGTNNFFPDRGNEYMAFVAPLLLFCSTKWYHKFLSSGVLIFYAVEFCMSLYSPTWHSDVYAEQKYDIRQLGIEQEEYVDKNTYGRREAMMPYLHSGDTVWCDTESWGFVELLNLVPITYKYRMNPALVDSVGLVFVRKEARYSEMVEYLNSLDGYDEVSYGRFSLFVKRRE